ncbi:MAG: hypothetical protein ABI211_13595 [Vicinamibacterales bacterium]
MRATTAILALADTGRSGQAQRSADTQPEQPRTVARRNAVGILADDLRFHVLGSDTDELYDLGEDPLQMRNLGLVAPAMTGGIKQ